MNSRNQSITAGKKLTQEYQITRSTCFYPAMIVLMFDAQMGRMKERAMCLANG